jgi:iron(II)-dependent oxidoreductase
VANVPAAPVEAVRMIEVPAGTATLGLPRAPGVFGWDNEFEIHMVEVPAFAIDEYKVTNGEFLKFLREGGYDTRSLWADSDWEWKEKEGIRHPCFWVPCNGSWNYRTMFAEVPLPLDWPVYVSHAEAAAYARWAGKQLPTEAQFHRAAYGTPRERKRTIPGVPALPGKIVATLISGTGTRRRCRRIPPVAVPLVWRTW